MSISMLKKLLFVNAVSGNTPIPTVEATATGNPATFTTDISRNLTGFSIPFTAIQGGSGDPSPDNVRQITGWTGVNVTANGTTIPVTFPDEAGMVYGGTLDLTTGVLTVDMIKYNAKDVAWIASSQISRGVFGINSQYPLTPRNMNTNNIICNSYKTDLSSKRIAEMDDNSIKGHATEDWIFYIRDSRFTTIESFTEEMAKGTVEFAYELAEPLEYQLTPQQLSTIIGENVISTDTNGTNTIKYLKKAGD